MKVHNVSFVDGESVDIPQNCFLACTPRYDEVEHRWHYFLQELESHDYETSGARGHTVSGPKPVQPVPPSLGVPTAGGAGG